MKERVYDKFKYDFEEIIEEDFKKDFDKGFDDLEFQESFEKKKIIL